MFINSEEKHITWDHSLLQMEIYIGLVLRRFILRHLFNATYQFTPLLNCLLDSFSEQN